MPADRGKQVGRAICVIADLEAASRGGGAGGAGEDTRALLAVRELTSGS